LVLNGTTVALSNADKIYKRLKKKKQFKTQDHEKFSSIIRKYPLNDNYN
jgi:Mor family transcriptional regulator